MAEIKQAAKWMEEGKQVRRPSFAKSEGFYVRLKELGDWIGYYSDEYLIGQERDINHSDLLTCDDLLADDGEIAE